MRKLIFVFALSAIALVSCNKDEVVEAVLPTSHNLIVGTWESDSVKFDTYRNNELENSSTLTRPYSSVGYDVLLELIVNQDSLYQINLKDRAKSETVSWVQRGDLVLEEKLNYSEILFKVMGLSKEVLVINYSELYNDNGDEVISEKTYYLSKKSQE